MIVLAWALFGLINGLVIYTLDKRQHVEEPTDATSAGVLGALGAVSGGIFAYLLFAGGSLALNSSLFVIVALEATLLVLLFSKKLFRSI